MVKLVKPLFFIQFDAIWKILHGLCECVSYLLFLFFFFLLFISITILSRNAIEPIHKVAGNERTVGADVSTMKIGKGEVSMLDFGGQLEYAVTHQFLLSVEVFYYLLSCKA
jgi:hypothetical protein